MNSDAQTSVEWRAPRGNFWIRLAMSLAGAGMFILCIACYMHPEWSSEDQIPLLELIFLEALFSIFTMMGLLVLWGGLVSRFSMNNERIEKIYPMGRESIQYEEVKAIDLLTRLPGHRIILLGQGKRFLISLGTFPTEIRSKILGILRQKLKNLPPSEWEKYDLEIRRREQLVEQFIANRRLRRMRIRRLFPSSDRLLLLGSLIVLGLNELFAVYSPNLVHWHSQFLGMLEAITIVYVMCGAPVVFLTSLWELIRHRRTWRTMAALFIAGLAIYVVVESFYNDAYRILRH